MEIGFGRFLYEIESGSPLQGKKMDRSIILHFLVPTLLRGNAYRKAIPSICESRLPYDHHAW